MRVVQCSCGHTCVVPDAKMGGRVACPACGTTVSTPIIASLVTEEAAAPPAPPLQSSPAAPPARQHPPEVRRKQQRPPPDDVDPTVERKRQEVEKQSGTYASNPGRLRLSYLRYSWCFPKWPVNFGLGILAGIFLAVLVHPALILLAAPFCGMMWLFWRWHAARFAAGCVLPAQIIALDPPLVAVSSNLSNGFGADVNVIKILEQPLHRMTGGAALVPGQWVAAVSLFCAENRYQADHWSDFYPVLINAGTGNVAEIERVQSSIEQSTWREMELELQRLPSPIGAGLYRVDEMPPEFCANPVTFPVTNQFFMRVNLSHKPDERRYLADAGIPPEQLAQRIESSGGKLTPDDAFALLGGFSRSQGIVLTSTHVKIVTSDRYVEFPWQALGCVLGYRDGFEFTLRTGQRIHVGNDCLWRANIWPLESLCDCIIRFGSGQDEEVDEDAE